MNLQPDREETHHLFERLFPVYREYCTSVSVRWMALSIETCVYTWWLCEQTKPKRLVDLGSGFSSYVLRLYQSEHDDVEVVSVDDSPEWLEKTARFLKKHHLPTDGLLGPDEFLATSGYDLAIYDYSGGEIREAFMAPTMERMNDDGFVILDDANHIVHYLWMAKATRDRGWALYSLVEQTLDQVERHAVLAHRGPS